MFVTLFKFLGCPSFMRAPKKEVEWLVRVLHDKLIRNETCVCLHLNKAFDWWLGQWVYKIWCNTSTKFEFNSSEV